MWRYLFALVFLVTYTPGLTSKPSDDKLERGVGLYQAKKYQEAESVLREAVNEAPGNPNAHSTLGLTLLELGKSQEALQEFQKALVPGPATDKVQIGMARAYLNLKDLETAS